MYAYISGILKVKEPALATIDVQGVGYEIRIPMSAHALIEVGKPCTLYTYLHVKEDIMQLFGFLSDTDKKLFMQLIGVSGIGPGTALVMLSASNASELKKAIADGNTRFIQQIKGIGVKTAERLIVELKDKMRKEGWEATADVSLVLKNSNVVQVEEAILALTTLGLSRAVAEKSLQAVLKQDPLLESVEEMVRRALKQR